MISCLTETRFHFSFLYERMRYREIVWVVKNQRQLNKELLDCVHSSLSKKEFINDSDICLLEKAYGRLSPSDIYLAERYGVPAHHMLSAENIIEARHFDEACLQKVRVRYDQDDRKGAVVFRDIMLNTRWMAFFDSKIVSAHSAMLPYALGQYAIEQIAVMGDNRQLEQAAGATLYYLDGVLDEPSLVAQEALLHLWNLPSIWAVKGESYLIAFRLLDDYLNTDAAFSRRDVIKQQIATDYRIFARSTLSEDEKRVAQKNFLSMKKDFI
ncbi:MULTISPECIES: hypothetical protein [Lonsdalea]|uniref:Uncharacterized protein n=2 Tax=Lonsdalea TaxID=1082702 RepID=A0ACD1JF97_9GAMM|nr:MULTISPECIES: hypothetical protein [Lonsdalea]OSM98171.1 hypothetical protein AU499_12965 [Lonsdalea populi]QPQ24422.1 hypothetical protein I6N93_00985 [Lonsdalea populi]RAT15159.1 hypothetical protein AU485_04345 [Lonsdalea quercina]RAT20252.1 hypothetical protein AU487_08525 [Lonsdalea populi]RAT25075.1 hypothetical protein AU488_06160 [Lonsdalea populi]